MEKSSWLTSGVLQGAIKSLQVHSCVWVCVYHFHMTLPNSVWWLQWHVVVCQPLYIPSTCSAPPLLVVPAAELHKRRALKQEPPQARESLCEPVLPLSVIPPCSQIIPGQASATGLIPGNLKSFSSYSFLVLALWPRLTWTMPPLILWSLSYTLPFNIRPGTAFFYDSLLLKAPCTQPKINL